MGFRMKISGGAEDIVFDERSITKVDFCSSSPADSNARATDFGLTAKVDCYRSAEITAVSAGQIVRQFTLPNAFVMEYSEEVDDESGVGTFYIQMKQKKDENGAAKIEGGFGGE